MNGILDHDELCAVIGTISDVQYSHHPDKWNFSKTTKRQYQTAIHHLRYALECFISPEENISILFQLGDLWDGLCFEHNHLQEAYREIEDLFEKYCSNISVHHLIGNHDLYNFSREELATKLCPSSLLFSPNVRQLMLQSGAWTTDADTPPHYPIYYALDDVPHWKFIILDGYDLSVLGLPPHHPRYVQSSALLDKHNANENKNSLGTPSYFTAYNGGIGSKQLMWLKDQLNEAEQGRINVVLVSHIPLLNDTKGTSNDCLWNHDEVLQVIRAYSSCIRLALCGHSHCAALHQDIIRTNCPTTGDMKEFHTWHLVLPAVVEMGPPVGAASGRRPHCTMRFYRNRINIIGAEDLPNTNLTWPLN